MGTHRKPQGTHGIGTRGPIRWERAAANALLRPNTKNARLYLRRVSNAFAIAEECRLDNTLDDRQPYEHLELVLWRDGEKLSAPEGKREYVTCSVHCMVMQAQLDHCTHEATLEEVRNVFTENLRFYVGYDRDTRTSRFADSGIPKIRPLAAGTLKRPARCQVCGTQVGGKK